MPLATAKAARTAQKTPQLNSMGHSPQFGFPKSRNSVKTHCRNSASSSHLAENETTPSMRSKLCARISAPAKSKYNSSPASSRKVTQRLLTFVTLPTIVDCELGLEAQTSIEIRGWSLLQPSTAFQKLSADEAMFVSHLYNCGLSRFRKRWVTLQAVTPATAHSTPLFSCACISVRKIE
jgi:hypothetical protein